MSDETEFKLAEEESLGIYVERTLALIKPEAVQKYEEIEELILRAGFTILQKRRVQLTPEQTSDFYSEHFGKLFFPSLVGYMSSGPIIALMLARTQATEAWKVLIGPTSPVKARIDAPKTLRALYGTDEQRNGLHGSENQLTAQRELRFFFADAIIEPIAEGQSAKDYLAKSVNPTLLLGLTELCKQKPAEPEKWLARWLMENNPYKAKVKEMPDLHVDSV